MLLVRALFASLLIAAVRCLSTRSLESLHPEVLFKIFANLDAESMRSILATNQNLRTKFHEFLSSDLAGHHLTQVLNRDLDAFVGAVRIFTEDPIRRPVYLDCDANVDNLKTFFMNDYGYSRFYIKLQLYVSPCSKDLFQLWLQLPSGYDFSLIERYGPRNTIADEYYTIKTREEFESLFDRCRKRPDGCYKVFMWTRLDVRIADYAYATVLHEMFWIKDNFEYFMHDFTERALVWLLSSNGLLGASVPSLSFESNWELLVYCKSLLRREIDVAQPSVELVKKCPPSIIATIDDADVKLLLKSSMKPLTQIDILAQLLRDVVNVYPRPTKSGVVKILKFLQKLGQRRGFLGDFAASFESVAKGIEAKVGTNLLYDVVEELKAGKYAK